jgi:hypothetical protein
LGGVDPQTAYGLETNEQGLYQLIVLRAKMPWVKKTLNTIIVSPCSAAIGQNLFFKLEFSNRFQSFMTYVIIF